MPSPILEEYHDDESGSLTATAIISRERNLHEKGSTEI